MQFGFWQQLKRPFTALAPMSGYTDAAFRRLLAKYGKPDVSFTEFVPASGLCSSGRDNLRPLLSLCEAERPVVAQLYGGEPDHYFVAAQFLSSLGFDGIDLNMGCPARIVEQRRGGSALIQDPARARQIIAAAQAGAGPVPVSVKTRLGYHADELEAWLGCLLAAQPAAITLHARTRGDTYNVPARWDAIARAVALAREYQPDSARRTLIIGNGDIWSLDQAYARAQASGCDGVMVGRATWGNPWFFSREIRREELSLRQVVAMLLEHTELYFQLQGQREHLEPLKKHYKAYINGFARAAELRYRLMKVATFEQLLATTQAALAQ